MIRAFTPEDLPQIMQIWLQTNLACHNFVAADFFQQNLPLVEIAISASTVYVQESDGVIKGFIGLMDNYVAGLFVATEFQGKGFGTLLLNKAKQLHSDLYLHVYKQNPAAIDFYTKQGFEIVEERLNDETMLPEFLMHCHVEQTVKIGKCCL